MLVAQNIKWSVLEMTYGAVPAQPTHAFNPILTTGVGNKGGKTDGRFGLLQPSGMLEI